MDLSKINLLEASLTEILLYFFENSRVANSGTIKTAIIGVEETIGVEPLKEGSVLTQIRATAWENIDNQPVVVIEACPYGDYDIQNSSKNRFILTHNTFKLIRDLISGQIIPKDIKNGNCIKHLSNNGKIIVNFEDNSPPIEAIAWWKASLGTVKTFRIDDKIYSIRLVNRIPLALNKVEIEGKEPKNKPVRWVPFNNPINEYFPKSLFTPYTH